MPVLDQYRDLVLQRVRSGDLAGARDLAATIVRRLLREEWRAQDCEGVRLACRAIAGELLELADALRE